MGAETFDDEDSSLSRIVSLNETDRALIGLVTESLINEYTAPPDFPSSSFKLRNIITHMYSSYLNLPRFYSLLSVLLD